MVSLGWRTYVVTRVMQMQPAWLFLSTVWEASYVAINNRLSYHRSGHPFHSLAVAVCVMLLETFCVCSPKKKPLFFFLFFPFAQKLEEISYLLNKPGHEVRLSVLKNIYI